MTPPQDRQEDALANASAIESQYYRFAVGAEQAEFALRGDWTILNVQELEGIVEELGLARIPVRQIEFSCGGLQNFDLSGAWLLYRTGESLKRAGFNTSYSGFRAEHLKFIEDVVTMEQATREPPPVPWLTAMSLRFTRATASLLKESRDRYLWLVSIGAGIVATVINPRRFRWVATARHIQDAGVAAIGIVGLMAFLVALVLGFQSQTQLSQFGAQIFTVDLVSISIMREMGGLLTAILVAGRSGSAFAAEIGVMQLNEEVSAMETMGIDPFEALVLPRMLALVICLPLLTFIADIAGLIGTVVIAVGMLDIPFPLVVERFLALDPMTHFKVGLIKAPFFALMIGSIGTYRGYYVERSADAVGRNTTNAVVESIFMVIVVDAIFSIIFTELGW
ncbi:MAG: ABC transporter permease [Halieaceae bacterium]|nr:ABC transporter permease [Halieaceae bacterium]